MQKDGLTYRQHLEAVAARSEKARRRLAGPKLPEAGAYLWGWFGELHASRHYLPRHMAPPVPMSISWAEMAAWARLTRRRPQGWEVDLLRELDRTWLAGPEKLDDD